MKLQLAPSVLRPIIEQAVTEVLGQLEAGRTQLDGWLAFAEAEEAELLELGEPPPCH